jgi:hypothetical protein
MLGITALDRKGKYLNYQQRRNGRRKKRSTGAPRHSGVSLELFFDESGKFEEGSQRSDSIGLDSQLVGVLAPKGELTRATATEVLNRSLTAAGLNISPKVHGMDLPAGSAFDRLIMGLVAALQDRKWQPVRLVNEEREVFGDHKANYTNMVAELVYRILTEKRKQQVYQGSLRIIAATVYKPRTDSPGILDKLSENEYIPRLQEYLTRLRVRMGLPDEKWQWELKGFKGGSGRSWPELQICDLLSNASYRNYAKVGSEAREALVAAFGKHTFTLTVREMFERVDVLLEEQALGMALVLLLECLAQPDGGGSLREGVVGRLVQVVKRLAGIGARIRNMYLTELTSYLEHVVGSHHSCRAGFRMARLALEYIVKPLRSHMAQPEDTASLDWFDFTMHSLALTASNHSGDLATAHSEHKELDRLLPSLAGRWEHAPKLISGLLAKAVHLTDTMEHSAAAALMETVANYYAELSGLFNAALPEVFPEGVRSDLRGMALGTWVQAEMYAGLSDPCRLEQARVISDQAIDEFSDPDDKERQYQYRCQLETYAGQLSTAREFLAKSLRAADSSHAEIASTISRLGSQPMAQGFALLHWFRLGAAACVPITTTEAEPFLSALRLERLLFCEWCTGQRSEYPAHGILRQAAVILAAQSRDDEAMSILAHQRRLETLSAGRPLLTVVQMASTTEVAGLLWLRNRKAAIRLLDCDVSDRLGAKQTSHQVSVQCQNIPSLSAVLEAIQQAIEAVLSGKVEDMAVQATLWASTKSLGY